MGEVERLAGDIGEHYLESRDFNGFPRTIHCGHYE